MSDLEIPFGILLVDPLLHSSLRDKRHYGTLIINPTCNQHDSGGVQPRRPWLGMV